MLDPQEKDITPDDLVSSGALRTVPVLDEYQDVVGYRQELDGHAFDASYSTTPGQQQRCVICSRTARQHRSTISKAAA